MDNSGNTDIIFMDSLTGYHPAVRHGQILHVLCMEGSMSFVFQDVMYNIAAGDYVILPDASLLEDFTEGEGLRILVMSLSDPYVASLAIKSDYGIIGHLFHDEMKGHLLMAHILDLYDIHARSHPGLRISERNADLMRRFMEMLYSGDYAGDRSLGHYASGLYVTPHYLSEVCRKVSGRPATYWIDHFTIQHIIRMLGRKDLSLSEIADSLNFSSLSYFSRYFQKMTGMSPSRYRNDPSSSK